MIDKSRHEKLPGKISRLPQSQGVGIFAFLGRIFHGTLGSNGRGMYVSRGENVWVPEARSGEIPRVIQEYRKLEADKTLRTSSQAWRRA